MPTMMKTQVEDFDLVLVTSEKLKFKAWEAKVISKSVAG